MSVPQLGVLASMLLSTAVSISPQKAVQPIISVTMLTLMVHFLYRAFDLDSTRSVLRICSSALVVALVISVATVGEGRDSGTFNNPNAWAGIILLLSPLAVAVLADWDAPAGNILLLALLGLFPIAILQSASRTGLVLMVLGSPFVLWLMRKHPWKVALAILIGAVVTARFAADTEALERARVLIDSDAAAMDSSLREREAMLVAAREILSEHWVMGIGVAMFSLYSAPWMAGEQWHAAHNVYLEIAAEQGVVGVITHLIFLGTLARVFWRVSFKEGPSWISQAGRGAAIGVGTFAAFMVAQNGMMTHAMFYFVIGLAVSLDRLKTQA